MTQLQSLTATVPRRKRSKPKLKLKIINQNSVAVLQTPPDMQSEHSRDGEMDDGRGSAALSAVERFAGIEACKVAFKTREVHLRVNSDSDIRWCDTAPSRAVGLLGTCLFRVSFLCPLRQLRDGRVRARRTPEACGWENAEGLALVCSVAWAPLLS